MDGHQPNYLAIACVLAVVYLVVQHLKMSKQLSDLGEGYSALGEGFSYLYRGFASTQQQQPQKRGAPVGYENPRRNNEPIRDRSERRQDRPVQDRSRGNGGSQQQGLRVADPTAYQPDDSDFDFLGENVFGQQKTSAGRK
jgi:hypothetical protein